MATRPKSWALWTALTAFLALILLLGGDILYSNWGRRHILVTAETPVQNLRTLCTVISLYDSKYNSFPRTLSALGPSAPGQAPSRDSANLIGEPLASGSMSGYEYRYRAVQKSGNDTVNAFEIFADPAVDNDRKQMHYFVNESGVIRLEVGKQASSRSSPLP
jgi:hypothetical protein